MIVTQYYTELNQLTFKIEIVVNLLRYSTHTHQMKKGYLTKIMQVPVRI